MEDDFRGQLIRQAETGRLLLSKRSENKLTQPKVAKALGISTSYLSELEKGLKMPSEQLIQEIAKYYIIDEDELFQSYGKIPLLAHKEIRENTYLQNALSELGRLRKKGKISDEQIDSLFSEVLAVYQKYFDEAKGE